MLYGELKKTVSDLLRGDNSKVEDMLLNDSTYLSMALRDISIRCIPRKLLGVWDESKTDVFRRVHNVFDNYNEVYIMRYVRKANVSVIDAHEVDIEEELIQAVIFFMCSYLSNKKQEDYIKRAEDVINYFDSYSVDLTNE